MNASGSFEVKLERIKNSLVLRIPKAIENALALKEGETVTLRVKGEKQIEISLQN